LTFPVPSLPMGRMPVSPSKAPRQPELHPEKRRAAMRALIVGGSRPAFIPISTVSSPPALFVPTVRWFPSRTRIPSAPCNCSHKLVKALRARDRSRSCRPCNGGEGPGIARTRAALRRRTNGVHPWNEQSMTNCGGHAKGRRGRSGGVSGRKDSRDALRRDLESRGREGSRSTRHHRRRQPRNAAGKSERLRGAASTEPGLSRNAWGPLGGRPCRRMSWTAICPASMSLRTERRALPGLSRRLCASSLKPGHGRCSFMNRTCHTALPWILRPRWPTCAAPWMPGSL
jgi:hypothetical protein